MTGGFQMAKGVETGTVLRDAWCSLERENNNNYMGQCSKIDFRVPSSTGTVHVYILNVSLLFKSIFQ